MTTTNQLNPFQAPAKKKATRPNANSFVEALKNIGGGTAKSLGQDVLAGTAKDFMGTFIGGNQAPRSEFNPSGRPDWLMQQEFEQRAKKEAERQRRHQEIINAEPLYDRRAEEVKQQIKALQEELRMLAADLAAAGTGIQKAIEEEVVNPGAYHLSFFEALRKFIANLRKQVAESSNWLDESNQRKQAQRHYQMGMKKSGTKFTLSQERQVATSVG